MRRDSSRNYFPGMSYVRKIFVSREAKEYGHDYVVPYLSSATRMTIREPSQRQSRRTAPPNVSCHVNTQTFPCQRSYSWGLTATMRIQPKPQSSAHKSCTGGPRVIVAIHVTCIIGDQNKLRSDLASYAVIRNLQYVSKD